MKARVCVFALRSCAALVATVLPLAVYLPAQAAESYPSRPIRLVVGFGAGGPTDIPARFIADKLGAALGQPVVVENKPAAGGIVATRDVLAQPRDGYALLLCTHFDATNTAVYRNAGSIGEASTPQEFGAIINRTLDDAIPTIQEFGLQQDQ